MDILLKMLYFLQNPIPVGRIVAAEYLNTHPIILEGCIGRLKYFENK